MCIAYLSIGHPDFPIRIAANRDEFHARPTRAAGVWPTCPDMLAGQDLQSGGTWLGCARGGRYALLTNFREPGHPCPPNAPSRGYLVRDFLLGEPSPQAYLQQLAQHDQQWAGFNLIVGDLSDSWFFSNRDTDPGPRALCAGVHVLSNHLLNTPWPKSERLRTSLTDLPDCAWDVSLDQVYDALHDTTQAPAETLPATGLSPELERLLSSPFIVSPDYGTRCSSVLTITAAGDCLLSEQSYDPHGAPTERHDWRLTAGQTQPG